MTEPTKIDIRTDDGVAPAWVQRPDKAGDFPGVILFPDAGSVRAATHEIAARVASKGYVVLTPNVFYRAGDFPKFDFKTVFSDPAERDRLMKIIRALDTESAMRDAAHYIRAVGEQKGVASGAVACMGYCMGGRLAFTAAGTYPEKVAAVACFHGGGLATDAPDSPHLAAAKIRARLYFGVADNDQSATPEQQAKLVTALAAAHLRFTIDHLAGVSHGYAMKDFPVYDQSAYEKHFQRIEETFGEAFAKS